MLPMGIYETLLIIGALGLAVMTLLGFMHAGHHGGHDHGHGHGHALHAHHHGHLHAGHAGDVHAGGTSPWHTTMARPATTPRPMATSQTDMPRMDTRRTSHTATTSTRTTTTPACGRRAGRRWDAAARAAVAADAVSAWRSARGPPGACCGRSGSPPLVAAVPSAFGAWFFYAAVLQPLRSFVFSFASRPAQTLEGMLLQQAEAITSFNTRGEELVRLTIDAKSVDVLARLDVTENGPRIRKGQRVLIEEVDPIPTRAGSPM